MAAEKLMDRFRWEEKHRDAEFLGEPAELLVETLAYLPRGRALDLACGLGGNALYLAAKGYEVEAFDWSVSALRKLTLAAEGRRLPVRAVACDLTRFPLPESRYDLVICFRYLERTLFEPMARALRPGGALVVQTFNQRHLDGRPEFPARFCLEENELLNAFVRKLRVASYRELPSETTACLLAFRESTAAPRGAAGGS